MEVLIYIFPFLLIMILTLSIHEGGHLLAAKALGVRAAGFQIGIGPKLATIHTGATQVAIPPELPLPPEGRKVYLSVNQSADGRLSAVYWKEPVSLYRIWKRRKEKPAAPYPSSDLILCGKVRKGKTEGRTVTVADMSWSIGLIPIMAMVELPESSREDLPDCYNTVSWKKQMIIVLAGVSANVLLMFMAIAALTLLPPSDIELLTVTAIDPTSPEYAAGLREGDALIQAHETPVPDMDGLRQAQVTAFNNNHKLRLELVNRRTGLDKVVLLEPGPGMPGTGWERTRRDAARTESIDRRFARLTVSYLQAIPQTLEELRSRRSGEDDGQKTVTGLPRLARYTGVAVERGGLQIWLSILGAVSMATAILNLAPFPPLDGYKAALHTVEAVRRRKFSPDAKFKLDFAGFALIVAAGIYLAIRDLISMSF